jgi:uncharacterized protein YbjT (DUF2867 family)
MCHMIENAFRPVVVTGASGRVGREIMRLLDGSGRPLRPTSRRPGERVHGHPAVPWDWDHPESWSSAIEDAGALFVVVPERPGALADSFARALTAAHPGPRRVVLLSALGAGEEGDTTGVVDLESAVLSIAPEPVVLRPNTYMQNLVSGFLAGALVERGQLVAPVGHAAVSFLDVRDLAEVAARALVGDVDAGQVITLTGPRALTFGEVAGHITAVSGRQVVHVDPGEDGMRTILAGAGLPLTAVDLVLSFFAGIRTGRHSVVTDDVERILRRPATDLATFAVDHASVWRPVAEGAAPGATAMDGTPTMVG